MKQAIKFSGFYLLLLSLLSGCSIFQGEPDPDIFYPPLPATPRIQFLTSYSSPADLQIESSSLSKFILGKEGAIDAVIKKPYGVAIYDGVIYVVDIRNHGYARFDLKTKKFDFIYGSFSSKMKKPINITIDGEGNKYIADILNGRVLVFDVKDNYVRSYIDDEDFKPSDVVITDDKLFVSCMAHHQVHVFDKNTGKKLYSIGKPGSKKGELFYPANLTLGPEGHLYVSETGNFRVQKFTQSGKHIKDFGKIGTGLGHFARPKGVALDREGRIFIVDAAFENVQILNKEGKLLLFFGEPGTGRGNINLPAAITIDYDNVAFFKKFAHPDFDIEYLILVASQFGKNKVNIFGYGKMQNENKPNVNENKNE